MSGGISDIGSMAGEIGLGFGGGGGGGISDMIGGAAGAVSDFVGGLPDIGKMAGEIGGAVPEMHMESLPGLPDLSAAGELLPALP